MHTIKKIQTRYSKRVSTHKHNHNYNEEKREPDYSKINTNEMKRLGSIPNNHLNNFFLVRVLHEKKTYKQLKINRIYQRKTQTCSLLIACQTVPLNFCENIPIFG